MKASKSILAAVNADRTSYDPDHAILSDLWNVSWQRRCFDPECRGEHAYRVIIGIGAQEGGLPEPRLALWEDHADAMVPMTKAAVAELIADLRACLDRLP